MDIVINTHFVGDPPLRTKPLSSQGNFYHNLLTCLGYPSDNPPLAALLCAYHGWEGDGLWLIVSPVHWQATHNDAFITASDDALQLTEEDARAWFSVVRDFLAGDDMQLYFHDNYTWVLHATRLEAIVAKPVQHIKHQSLMPQLHGLSKSLFWQRLITESQMLLNHHPLHTGSNKPFPINGLWFWGHGDLYRNETIPLYYADAESQRLGSVLAANTHDLYSTSIFAKNSVLLCNTLDAEQYQLLLTRTQKQCVQWYWNNLAYVSQSSNWFARMMEKLK